MVAPYCFFTLGFFWGGVAQIRVLTYVQTNNGTAWLAYDFGFHRSFAVHYVAFEQYPVVSGHGASAVSVQFSDDASTWTTAWTTSGLSGGFEEELVKPQYLGQRNATTYQANFTAGDRQHFLSANLLEEGVYTFWIDSSVCTDEAHNPNEASNMVAVRYDRTPPVFNLTSNSTVNSHLSVSPQLPEAHRVTNASPFVVVVAPSERVYNFNASDVAVTGNNTYFNGTAFSNVTHSNNTNLTVTVARTFVDFNVSGGGAVTEMLYDERADKFTVLVAPSGDGPVFVQIPARAANDVAGNPSVESEVLSFLFDSEPPKPTLSTSAGAVARTSPIPFELVFSEGVSGLTVDDLVVTSGAASNLVGLEYGTDFTFVVRWRVWIGSFVGAMVVLEPELFREVIEHSESFCLESKNKRFVNRR